MLTQGAGSSEPRVPYEERFPDKYGNLCVRHVARPQVIVNYFKYSKKVDVHNQVRKLDIGDKIVTVRVILRYYSLLI